MSSFYVTKIRRCTPQVSVKKSGDVRAANARAILFPMARRDSCIDFVLALFKNILCRALCAGTYCARQLLINSNYNQHKNESFDVIL